MENVRNAKEVLLNYAGRFCDQAAGQSAIDFARERGWLNEGGDPTPEGRKAADALADQLKTRSAFRIG